jgi:methylated-DNA-[protein]-cysteine S-methyltransferase
MTRRIRLLTDRIETPIGQLAIVADQEGALRAVEWVDHDDRLRRMLRIRYGADGFDIEAAPNPAGLSEAMRAYFRGDLHAIGNLPVAATGTPFQLAVWAALRKIPCGDIISYGELARRIGSPAAVRAVGLANGANPIGIVVPCHRVIGANGSLTGYGGGIDRKRWLIVHERRAGNSPELPLTA